MRTCCKCGADTPKGTVVCGACRKPKTVRSLRPDLTFRERQVIDLVCQAKPNKEIAWELKLTEGTVKEYLNHIFRKLGVNNRVALVVNQLGQR
jgi:DNA-binding NarL/FixJ family response regulator